LDLTNGTLNKKIRNAQLAQFNYIAVVGEKEEKTKSVNLRDREKKEPLVCKYENLNKLAKLGRIYYF